MKVFQDLIIRGSPDRVSKLVDNIGLRLEGGWSRQTDREKQVSSHVFGPMFCFACAESTGLPASELWIATRSSSEKYVSNIVPSEKPSLSEDEYNRILQTFYERFAKPAAEELHVIAELGSPDLRIDDFLSSGAAARLRNFSKIANRSILHSVDRRRWNEFLAAAYRENSRLESSMLRRWLVEEEQWPADIAIELSIEYDHGRELLKTYESQPA